MAKKKIEFDLPTLDDLFTSQEERDEMKLSKIREIPIDLIDDFPDHPYHVREDEDMLQLMESVRERGVMVPALIRKKEDGRYEMIAGHRRKQASILAGFNTLRCEVLDVSRDEATIIMVESNFQRSTILPSEKAFAYKMRLDAMKRQGKRNDLTSDPVGPNLYGLRSNAELSDQVNESVSQIKRFIRLTNLVPELLEFVDEGRMKMRPAVELSYLDEDAQRDLVDAMDLNDCTPSHAQAIRMRRMFDEGELDADKIDEIMMEEKPNQKERFILRGDRVRRYLPKNIPPAQTEDYILKALEHYGRFLRSREDRDER